MVNNLVTPVSISEVGVLLLGFNRPELLHKRIKEIYESKLENLYISIDGGLESHTKEMNQIKTYAQNKFSDLHFFSLTHHENNLGLVKHVTGEIAKVLANHKYIIVIEDDIKISINFITNMINGLTIHKSEKSIGIVSGFSPLHVKYAKNKWRTSRNPYMWGWACSKETWDNYEYDLSNTNLEKELSCSKTWSALNPSQKMRGLGLFKKVQLNPLETWDAQLLFLSYCKDFINLAPIFSIVGNEGFNDSRATHTKGKKPNLISISKINSSVITKKSKVFNNILDSIDNYWMNDF